MNNSLTAQRLSALRQAMQQHQVDYYYVPSTDAHYDEYVPACWQRRAWISQFTGSAGDVLVGLDEAFLWTDPRYFLQAEQELDGQCFSLMKVSQGAASTKMLAWLLEHAAGKRVAVDPRLISAASSHRWSTAMQAHGIELVALSDNLVDAVWQDQPELQQQPIHLHSVEYAGETVAEKLQCVRQALADQSVEAHVVSLLDANCWLFNIRGQDIDYNPLVISYAVVTQSSAQLYMDVSILTQEQRDYFDQFDVELHPYDQLAVELATLESSVLLDMSSASWWLAEALSKAKVVLGESPITLMKACKNAVEQQGAAEAHRLDAIVMLRFWMWLEQNWQGQTEISISDHLAALRYATPECRGLSFPSICGFADHGAIIHYQATPDSDREIDNTTLLLLDSGGQYNSGTTDITRVFHLGEPSQPQKHHYTLVLRGHLTLSGTTFPAGTMGEHLNVLAHRPLWQEHCDFGHGTGHGIGSYLCVHEGPHRISGAVSGVPLLPGMLVSNEPGLYLTGHYGIRIENVCCIKAVEETTVSLTGHGPFYRFEDLTLVPYDINLINAEELNAEEIHKLNKYHQRVYDTLSAGLSEEERAWLAKKTEPVLCEVVDRSK